VKSEKHGVKKRKQKNGRKEKILKKANLKKTSIKD